MSRGAGLLRVEKRSVFRRFRQPEFRRGGLSRNPIDRVTLRELRRSPGSDSLGGRQFRRAAVSRKLRAAVAQLGPIHLADSREAVVKRLCALLREAHGAGVKFVVFPELALTTFFPRYWMTEQAEIDRYFERDMPSPETRALFDLAKELGIGVYLGYAELNQEKGEPRHYNTSILVDRDGRIIGRYRNIHLPDHSEHL